MLPNNTEIVALQGATAEAEKRYGLWLDCIAKALRSGGIDPQSAAELRAEARKVFVEETRGVYDAVRHLGSMSETGGEKNEEL